MAGLLALTATDPDGMVRVSTVGDIAGLELGSEANPFHSLLGREWAGNRVLLSMSHTAYIDSAAVSWLIMSHREFKKGGGGMVLYSVPDSVRQVLGLLKIDRLIPVAGDETAARAAMASLLAVNGQPAKT